MFKWTVIYRTQLSCLPKLYMRQYQCRAWTSKNAIEKLKDQLPSTHWHLVEVKRGW